ncbi:hypothetical protein [Polaribacter vadi]|uniref:hypothetical protein n=1 Tax=Polaribacter vadi TaxID=1774273 RepID=UPI0030EF3E2E
MLIIAFVLSLQNLIAQDDYRFNGSALTDYQLLSSPSVQSPDVSAFLKVTQIPVSNYTGRANISVPIYNIKVGNMNVPISITYNSSGVKVADMPSNVGSNWALNAGGMVTKIVQGIDDFIVPSEIFPGSPEKTPAGWLSTFIGYTPSNNQQNDPAPDIYHVSAPGIYTKYIHEKDYSSSTNPTPVEIENNGNLIEESAGIIYSATGIIEGTSQTFTIPCFGMEYINVTALNGVQYNFSTPEISHTNSQENNGFRLSINDIAYKANAFKLDQMYDPATNQTIEFEYETYANNFYDKFYYRPGVYTTTRNVVSNRLILISFEGGTVEFKYDLDRIDNSGEKALTEVVVKNHLGTVIKHFKFEYGYFQSTINSTTAQSKRLRLDKLYQVDENGIASVGEYVFSYNTSINMPPRDSWSHDFLGYNNGSYVVSTADPEPKLYFDNNAYNNNSSSSTDSYRSVFTPFQSSGTFLINNNQQISFSLEANEEASKAYILTSIKYPTGGRSEFEYESNEFSYKGNKKGGGLRIKSQRNVDEYGIEQIQDYDYWGGMIANMPQYVNFKFLANSSTVDSQPTNTSDLNISWLKIYNVPQSQVELTNDSFVGYQSVSIKNRYDKQVTKYTYYNYIDYPNLPSTKTIFDSSSNYVNAGSRNWMAFTQHSLYLSRDILRGKLHFKTVFDQNEVCVLKQEYQYLLKEFRTILYTFQNPSSFSITNAGYSNCYTSSGLYIRGCGGYDEVINFPIERNLLITVETKVLEDLHEGTYSSPQAVDYAAFVETEKRYHYDSQYPRILAEEQGRNFYPYYDEQELEDNINRCQGDLECEERVRNEYVIQHQDGSSPEYIRKTYLYPNSGSILYGQHRLSTPEFVEIKNENEVLKSEDYHYKDYGGGIVAIENVDYIGNDRFGNLDPKTSFTVKRRDAKTNILEVLSQDGMYTSFIYGYGSRYLVCELKNVSYTQLLGAATTLNISLNELINSNTDTQIRTITNDLRGQLPLGQITSYTYKPLVGVTSVTDVRGRETTYKYDDYNRLEYIKDHDQNILSKNTYKYKN